MLRTILLKSLLIVTLLFAQQGAVLHGIAHSLAQQSQDQSLPHHKHCDLCTVYAQVGSAVGSSSVYFDHIEPAFASPDIHPVSFRSITFAAFAARAPPRSV
jgi:hypothetical protein